MRTCWSCPRYDNKVVAIPLNIEGPILEWRQDVFDACHIQPPNTLEEIEPVAAKLKACQPNLVSVRLPRAAQRAALHVRAVLL